MTVKTETENKKEEQFWSIGGLFLQEVGMLGVFALSLTLLLMAPMIVTWLS